MSSTVYVKRFRDTEEALRSVMECAGCVTRMQMLNTNNDWCIVYAHETSAQSAVRVLNGAHYDGHRLHVTLNTDQSMTDKTSCTLAALTHCREKSSSR